MDTNSTSSPVVEGGAQLVAVDSVRTSLQVLLLASGYAAALSWLERRWPGIKPDHIWAEVVGGVALSLIPVSLAARQALRMNHTGALLDWRTYEQSVWLAFASAGVPIVLWQLGEALARDHSVREYGAYLSGTTLDHLLANAGQLVERNPTLAAILVNVARHRIEQLGESGRVGVSP